SQGVQKSELDQFKQEVEKRLDESESAFFWRLDSLEQKFRESQVTDTLVTPAVVTPPVQNNPPVNKPADSVQKNVDLKPVVDAPQTSGGYVPTDEENEIYLKYLKRRWALPGDLTSYELKLAKDEIMQDVGRQYTMSAEEVLQLIDRVYEYRKAKKLK
ncbi:MAG: hypothetical protein WBP42_13150, partial [Candidatus Zixiibacteriota bacterium]